MPLLYLNPTEPFNLYLVVSLVLGLFVAAPFVFYQFWLFIAPGLCRTLALELARWLLRRLNQLAPLGRSALNYSLAHGGHVGDGQVMFTVRLSLLLEALDVLGHCPEPEE